MNLYVWEGEGVLSDFTDGMICAIANDLDEAYLTIERDDGLACYRRNVNGKDEWTFNFPKVPTRIIPLEMLDGPVAFVCFGGG